MRNKWMIAAVLFIAVTGTVVIASAQVRPDAPVREVGEQTPMESAARDAAIVGWEAAIQAQEHDQPIAFPHNVHVSYGLNCQYCHFSAERSPSAGIPPVATCVGCHAPGRIAGQSEYAQSQIALVNEYANNGETIPWVRIHKVAEHVKFPHHRHVNAGVQCVDCHGDVPNLGVWEQPNPEWGNGKMGWCISCHVEQEVNRDCTACHY